MTEAIMTNSSVLRTPIGDEEMLLVEDTGGYLVVNQIGSLMLDALTNPMTLEELVLLIAEATSTASDQIDKDIREFIAKLIEERVIVPAGIETGGQ